LAKNGVRELLISTATDLFSKKKYLNTSIREIGEAAKIHPSLLYHYFKNKEEILFTIIERFSIHLINSLQEVQSGEPDHLEGLRKMIFRHLLFIREFRREVLVTVEENTMLKGRLRTEATSYQRRVYGLYLDQLTKLNELNLVRPLNLKVICFSILGMINWFFRWYKEGGQLNIEEAANQIVEITCLGIQNVNRNHGKIQ
jgi:TetR/AcrR family transcriptional regulator, cholesterol catabolism regulator